MRTGLLLGFILWVSWAKAHDLPSEDYTGKIIAVKICEFAN